MKWPLYTERWAYSEWTPYLVLFSFIVIVITSIVVLLRKRK